MKRSVIWSLILAGLLTVWSAPGVYAAQPLKLATAGAGDFFWIMGKELTRIWNAAGLPSVVVETTGDRENLDLLVSGKADIALVSGFALADYLRERPDAPIVTVATCWKDAVHLLLNKRYIKSGSLGDLNGRKLYLGAETSPDGKTVRDILSALGVKPNRFARETTRGELLSVMSDFKRRELDGAIIIGVAPDPMVSSIIDKTGDVLQLIGVDASAVSTLTGAGLPVFLTDLPAESYSYQSVPIPVIATGTYLVARPDLADDTARGLRDDIFDNTARIAAYFPQGGTLSPDEAAAHLIAPLHPGLK
jgi:TRAP transporter TAXI family solute receptor